MDTFGHVQDISLGLTIWLFNIANWKIHYKWSFIAGKIICFYGLFSIAMLNNQSWLVVSTPLKNISQLESLFPIYGKIKNVLNHQPESVTIPTCDCSSRLAASSFSLSSVGSCPAGGTASTGVGAGAAEGAAEGAVAAAARLADFSLVWQVLVGWL